MSDARAPSDPTEPAAERRDSTPGGSVAGEAWYRDLFNHSLSGILLIDPETGQILAANPEACRLLGYTAAELCTLNRSAIVDTADPRLAAAVAERERAGRFHGWLTYRRADGHFFPVEVESALFVGPDGRTAASVRFSDISERKSAETELQGMPEPVLRLVHELQVHQVELQMQNEELVRGRAELEALHNRYEKLYNLAPVGYVTLDRGGQITEANRTLATMLGVERAQLAGMPLVRFIDPADQDSFYLQCRARGCDRRGTGERPAHGCWRWHSLMGQRHSDSGTRWRRCCAGVLGHHHGYF